MSALTLADVRTHLGFTAGEVTDDGYLELLMAGALRSTENFIDRAVSVDDPDEGAINTAMLLLIGHWYANREAVAVGTQKAEMPMAVSWLLMPVRKWVC